MKITSPQNLPSNRKSKIENRKSFHLSSFVFRLSAPAFSLVEVLLAMFILGIGLIMVASVFPVGANWTRQTTEDSVGQTIAQNALAVIKSHYGPGGDLHYTMYPDYFKADLTLNAANKNSILQASGAITPFALQAFPLFGTDIPASERAYQFGSANPFPAAAPLNCTYFWTALVRLNPAHRGGGPNGIQPAASYKYDVYILAFRKGDSNHTFSIKANEVTNTRSDVHIPRVEYQTYAPGTYNANLSPPVTGAIPGLGQIGIGVQSGTVFRQIINNAINGTTPRPPLLGQTLTAGGTVVPPTPAEPIIYSPPADGANASPLIYVYQTTLTF